MPMMYANNWVPTLSIRQPWADAILYGGKNVENRVWPLPEKFFGWIAIHAAKTFDKRPEGLNPLYDEVVQDAMSWPQERGAIIGFMLVTHCVKYGFAHIFQNKWEELDAYKFVIDDVSTLDKPIPCLGRQKIFNACNGITHMSQQDAADLLNIYDSLVYVTTDEGSF